MNFTNKVVWITGASSGIGKALAIELAKKNTRLILSARNETALKQVKQVCDLAERVKILPLDLADTEHFQKTTEKAIALFGRIDILVNNGGISQRALAKNTSIAVDKRIMDVNYIGTVALSKALLPHFIENKSGHFVVTTSIVGKIGTPLRSSYAASKHALHGFFDSLRAENYNYGIAVTIVCPGFVATDVSINALTGNGTPQNTMDEATRNGIPTNRFAKKMAKAIYLKKEEVAIAGFKEKSAVYIKRFFPRLLSIIIRKLSVT